MPHYLTRTIAALAVLLALAPPARAGQPASAAVFDLEIVDTSGEGEKPEHARRLAQTSAAWRRALGEAGRFAPVAIEPAAARVADAGYLHGCNGCESAIARDLGAAVAVTGVIYKISTLIMYISITVRDSATGAVLVNRSVSIRGDTDESWRRGVQYLAKNVL
jgi:Protein of unknown function (DUF2380)